MTFIDRVVDGIGLYFSAILGLAIRDMKEDWARVLFCLSVIGISDWKRLVRSSGLQVVKIVLRGVCPAFVPVEGEALTSAPFWMRSFASSVFLCMQAIMRGVCPAFGPVEGEALMFAFF